MQTIQPTKLEQLTVSTIQGLRQLEEMLGYEFSETIYHIAKLYDLKKPVTAWESLSQEQKLERERELIEKQAYLTEVSQ